MGFNLMSKVFFGSFRRGAAVVIAAACLLAFPGQSVSARIVGRGGQPAKGTINLPYRCPAGDGSGNQWYIDQGGTLRHQGRMPMFSEAAVLNIDGNQVSQNNNQARIEDNGEIVIDDLQGQNCTVSRRIAFVADKKVVRIVDVIKNTQAQEQTYNIMLHTSMNYGFQGSQMITDPKKKEGSIGVVAQDGQNRSMMALYCGPGSKMSPAINPQPNNNAVEASFPLTVPGGREVAIVHVHAVVSGLEAANKFVADLKESKLLSDLPRNIRRLIINFVTGQALLPDADLELLRGELFDVIELRSGDQYKGTLKDPSFQLKTLFGSMEVPAAKVVGLFNVGQSRPRQLIVTSEGEIYGGKLQKESLTIELCSGQTTQIPLSQITRAGYRVRAGEPDEWTFDKPLVWLRTGERMAIEMPAGEIALATRYGPMKLSPSNIASLVLQSEETSVHQVLLTDGSKFSAVVTAENFQVKLRGALLGGAEGQAVTFPAGVLARLQFAGKVDEIDDTSALIKLTNDDVMVGTLAGEMKLDTAFDTLTLKGEQIKSLTRVKGATGDVQVKLFDDTTVSGQFQENELNCLLKSGLKLKVPLALLVDYVQPYPQPPEPMLERIKQIVADMNSDNFQVRERAEAQLTAMGPAVIGVLKQMAPSQSPEVNRHIAKIIAALKNPGGKTKEPTAPPVLNKDSDPQ